MELTDLENKIAASRRFFNNAVQEYNTGIQRFPAALFAGPLGSREAVLRSRRRAPGRRRGPAGEVLAAGRGRPRAGRRGIHHGGLRSLQPHPVQQAALDRAARRPVLPGLRFRLCRRAARRGAHRQRPARRADAPRLDGCRERAAVRHDRHGDLDTHRLQVPSIDDRCADRRARGDPGGAAAALQSPGKSLHLARHHHAEAQGGGRSGAQCLRDRHEREAILHHGHLRPPRTARRRRDRSRCSATS